MPSVRGALNFFQAPWSEIFQPRATELAGRLRIHGPRSKKNLIRLLDAWCLELGACVNRAYCPASICRTLGACGLRPSRQTTFPFPWKSKTGFLMLAIGYILNVAVPACTAIQALVALLGCGARLALRHYCARPRPAARCSSVDHGS